MNLDIFHSSKSDEYATPDELYGELDQEFDFTLDAAATFENAKCANYYTKEDDALTKLWHGRVFCNPAYSKVKLFVEHAIRECNAGRPEVIVMVVTNRTSAIWFREAFEYADEVRAISGNLKFGDAKHPATFGTVVFVFRPKSNIWTPSDLEYYEMPKRHKGRNRWFNLKHPERVEFDDPDQDPELIR